MPLPAPITSRTNARVKALRAASDGGASEPGELVAIEGENLIAEALRSRIRIDTLFLREGSEHLLDLPQLRPVRPATTVVLSRDVFASAVATNSPQGIAALIAIPDVRANERDRRLGITLVLESLQDPGNMGTMLRSAEAFGVAQVFLTPDTVNPWNPKAIRASAGSVFRVPAQRMTLAEAKEWFTTHGIRLFAAVAEASGAIPCNQAEIAGACALMIGNEGAGLSAEALALADARIHIPCRTESLNAAAAAAALLYESTRQRIESCIPAAATGARR
jgi:RNA methyltransferase, TrmH family